MSYWVYDEVFSCMYDVGVYCHWMDVLLMYVVGYGCHVDVCSKWYACSILMSLVSMCEVMGLHMYIELVGLY